MTRWPFLIAAAAALCLLAGCGEEAAHDHRPYLRDTARSEPAFETGTGGDARDSARHHEAGTGDKAASLPGDLPVAYTGVLPCADCDGIRHDLLLFPDTVFYLRTVHLGRLAEADGRYEPALYDIGRWALSPEGRIVTLHGYDGRRMLAVLSDTTLRMLDREGRRIESTLDHDLTLIHDMPAIEPRLAMRGMYVCMADAGIFEECSTGRRFAVAQEADNAALERAYTEMRVDFGRPLLATLTGMIAQRASMEGDRIREMLVVEAFEGIWPGETCGPRFSEARLENTYWALVRLAGSPVAIPPMGREPHFRLIHEECRVVGHAGCNTLAGSYVLDGEGLEFTGLASTRRACPDGIEQERRFMEAMESVRTFRITGEHLELFDDGGRVVARFESRYMQ